MVAIARGLMSDPQILIIDELSLGPAPVVVYQLLATLKRLKQAGLTILLVEQNVHLALALSDYAYVVAEGRIFTEGLPAELVAKPEIRRAYFGIVTGRSACSANVLENRSPDARCTLQRCTANAGSWQSRRMRR